MELADVGEVLGSLTLEERAVLEVAIKQLARDVTSLRFWGRITGSTADYLVVCGLPAQQRKPTRKYFFASTSELVLKPLPNLSSEFVALIQSAGKRSANGALQEGEETKSRRIIAHKRFTGDASTVLEADIEEEQVEGDETVDENGNPVNVAKPEKFTEAHWLAHTIQAIDRDTSIVPKGAFTVSATHEIQENRSFDGLSINDASDANSLLHFRAPESKERSAAVGKAASLGNVDFLDPITEDVPIGQRWAVRVDEGDGRLLARSLKWVGYQFWHDVRTPRYGSIYVGDGLPSVDTPFMV